MNVADLTPLPWFTGQPVSEMCLCSPSQRTEGACRNLYNEDGVDVTHPCAGLSVANAEFLALASQAFEISLRRGWWTTPWFFENGFDRWIVRGSGDRKVDSRGFPDPFTALVEAERWCKEHGE